MKVMAIRLDRRSLGGLLAGGLIGCLVLHPASMLVMEIGQDTGRTSLDVLRLSFSVEHLSMAAYFMVLGLVIGAVHAFYVATIVEKTKRVQMLEGMLPICGKCKRIRDDEGKAPGAGEWIRMEAYISQRSEAQFSHSICPECAEQLFSQSWED